MENIFERLKETELFRGISAEEGTSLLKCLAAVRGRYEKGESVALEGEPARYAGLLLSGRVHIVKEDYYGNRSIVSEVGEGRLFGEVFACAGLNRMPVSVLAAENSEILFIDCKKILTACSLSCPFHHTLTANLLKIVSEKALFLNQKIDLLSRRTTREKLLSYLSAQAKKCGAAQFEIPFNRQELADFLCVDRSAMSAELGRMKRDGLIDYTKNRFRL